MSNKSQKMSKNLWNDCKSETERQWATWGPRKLLGGGYPFFAESCFLSLANKKKLAGAKKWVFELVVATLISQMGNSEPSNFNRVPTF